MTYLSQLYDRVRAGFLSLLILLAASLSMAAAARAGDIITNGTFGTPAGSSLFGWTAAGTVGSLINNPPAAQGYYWEASAPGTLTQTGLSGWNPGYAPSGAAALTFELGWNNGGPDADVAATLTVSIAGVTYATITTGRPSGSPFVATLAFQNGATGTPATLATPTTNAFLNWQGAGATRTVTINLPATVAASGDLVFSFSTGAGSIDDIFIANISAISRRPTLKITKQSIGGTSSFTFTGNNGWASQAISTATSNPNYGRTQTLAAASTATTITEAAVAGYATTAITCTGLGAGTATPNLAARSVTLNAAATAGPNTISCTFTNTRPAIAFRKISLGGVATFNFNSPVNLASAPAAITTTTAGLPAPPSPTAINVTTVGTAATLTETPAAGYALTGFSCTDANSAVSGNPASFGSFSGNVVTVPATNVRAGAAITCTITNTRPNIAFQKITLGGINTFSYSLPNNLAAAPGPITTTTAGVAAPVAPTAVNVTTVGTAATLTENATAGYVLTGFACTDSNSAVSGNPGSFGSFAGSVVTVPATNVRAGAAIRCTLTNTRLPTLTINKTSAGGTSSFPITITNASSSPITLDTTAANPASNTQTLTLAAISSGSVITESLGTAYFMSSANCSGLGSGSASVNTAAATITLNAAATSPGAAITCNITNTRAVPAMTVNKTASPASVNAAGDVISYTIAVSNTGNVALSSINVSDPLGPVTCPTSGNSTIASLAIGAIETCTMSYTATQADFDGANPAISNTAGSSTSYGGNPVTSSATALVSINRNPGLAIDKRADKAGPLVLNEIVTYTYTVTNTGNVTVTGVTVTDTHNATGPLVGPGNEAPFLVPNGSTDAAANGSWDTLRPGDAISFSATYQVRQEDIDTLQ